jgi:hypothetical protein
MDSIRYPLVKPRASEVFYGTAIDEAGTRIREDCYSLTETQGGGITLRVMIAVPPQENVFSCGAFRDALKAELTRKKSEVSVPFLQMKEKLYHSLHLGRLCEGVIAEYEFSPEKEFLGESLYLGFVGLEQQLTYQETSQSHDMVELIHLLENVFKHKPHLQRHFGSSYINTFFEADGAGSKFVFGLLELFNHTCRTVARREQIPFVRIHESRKRFVISKGYARFNRAFRDPCAFINLTNLTSWLANERYLSGGDLLQLLPILK